ncbi:RNA polymerase sigma factor [Pseudarcicella hirudinis]|uniref:RNA polymerase sigma factor n=1 Tax=Pseudarcicella hirudinis TaxID=1079859 RepID=UPI0035EB8A88
MKLSQLSSPVSDIQLWEQLKNGSELALGKLIRKYFNLLQNYGFKFIKDEDFIKDCVQEVFIEIWNRRDNISIPESVKAYLLSSVRKKGFAGKLSSEKSFVMNLPLILKIA